MRARKTVVFYLNNGNMKSQVAKEIMFGDIINEFVDEGREIRDRINAEKRKVVKFADGSQILLLPFGTDTLGLRLTDIYIDESVFTIDRADEIIRECYMVSLSNHYSGTHPIERIKLFNNDLQISKYSIDKSKD